MNKLDQAIIFAYKKHEGQLDDIGEPYIIHPMQVMRILELVTKDEDVLCAGVLHDTIEDTETTYEEIREVFGVRVADLVNEVTQEGKKDHIGYYFPRLKTKEGIIIKFADRLSNITRMGGWDQERIDHYLKKSQFWKSSP